MLYNFLKELRNKEEELSRIQLQQKLQQESLIKMAQELKDRELDVLSRELNIIMTHNAPTPSKRKMRKPKLKVCTLNTLLKNRS